MNTAQKRQATKAKLEFALAALRDSRDEADDLFNTDLDLCIEDAVRNTRAALHCVDEVGEDLEAVNA